MQAGGVGLGSSSAKKFSRWCPVAPGSGSAPPEASVFEWVDTVEQVDFGFGVEGMEWCYF